MIPALVVPVLNRPDLLTNMLLSIDERIEDSVIIDNGDVVVEPWICDTFCVVTMPRNIGVAASWNLGIKLMPEAPWWLIANSDIQFSPGDLATIAGSVTSEPGIWLAPWFSCFAINAPAIEKIGWFDESIHPAYHEDNDVRYRAILAGVPIVELQTGITHETSSTINSDVLYADQNSRTFPLNRDYYVAKWGGAPYEETFTTPFNRGGDLRPPQPDLARLRQLAWRRR